MVLFEHTQRMGTVSTHLLAKKWPESKYSFAQHVYRVSCCLVSCSVWMALSNSKCPVHAFAVQLAFLVSVESVSSNLVLDQQQHT